MIIYVGCWPILAFVAGKLIPAIGSGDLLKVSSGDSNAIDCSLSVLEIT